MAGDWWKKLPAAERAEYARSEKLSSIALPNNPGYAGAIEALVGFLADENRAEIERAANGLVRGICKGLEIRLAAVKVSGGRPHDRGGELQGLYEPAEKGSRDKITVWMRTAKRGDVVAPRTFLRTLLHEVVHHIDIQQLELPNSYHTKGFYQRESSLYRVVVRGTALQKKAQRSRPRPAPKKAEPKGRDPNAPPTQAAIDGLAMLRAVAEEIRSRSDGPKGRD